MAKRIFLDVGGHLGQSVAVALDPAWRFDRVYTFEPDPEAVRAIQSRFSEAIASGRLVVKPVAVGDHDGEIQLFGDNSKGGASVVAGALAEQGTPFSVPLIDINRFVAELGPDTRLYIKLNCEGGEVAILERLSAAQSVETIAAILADFDVVKTGFGYYRKRRVMARALAKGLPVVLAERVMVGKTHAERLANWLSYHPEVAAPGRTPKPRPQLLKRRIKYGLRDLRSALGLNAPGYRRLG